MPSSVKADLLDDGIVDTLVSVGATRLDNAAADSTDPHKRIHSHRLEYTVRPVHVADTATSMRSHCAPYREEYPSEGAALDEVTKCLCSSFKRKSLSDDRLNLARFKKLCDRRPCSCPSR